MQRHTSSLRNPTRLLPTHLSPVVHPSVLLGGHSLSEPTPFPMLLKCPHLSFLQLIPLLSLLESCPGRMGPSITYVCIRNAQAWVLLQTYYELNMHFNEISKLPYVYYHVKSTTI